jgi:hypothetical protein
MSAEGDEVESPFQQCIQLASVPVVDVLFPTSERWQDVAGCPRDVGCGEPDAHEMMKGLRPFSSAEGQCMSLCVGEGMQSRELGERFELRR